MRLDHLILQVQCEVDDVRDQLEECMGALDGLCRVLRYLDKELTETEDAYHETCITTEQESSKTEAGSGEDEEATERVG